LAFPADVQEGDESISVLAPLGTALLGRRVGDVVEAEFEGRRICCEVAELLYQPEAAGDFHR
jgi:regulator of nucleoside diphosphate kinase